MDHDDAVLLEFQRRYVAGAGEEGGVKKGARRGETRRKELNVKTAEEEKREEELEEEEKRKKVEKARAVLAGTPTAPPRAGSALPDNAGPWAQHLLTGVGRRSRERDRDGR